MMITFIRRLILAATGIRRDLPCRVSMFEVAAMGSSFDCSLLVSRSRACCCQ
jgi:hypothetical protein